MIIWNRELASLTLDLLYFLIIIFAIIRRKKLGPYIIYIIFAISITFCAEVSSFIRRWLSNGTISNTLILYNIGILGIAYFLFLFYFYKIVENRKLKKIQIVLVVLQVINYFVSMYFIDNFLNSLPDITSFINIILLLIAVSIFFQDTFNSDKVLYLKSYYPFFVAVSLTFIYVALIPLLFFRTKVQLQSEITIFYIMLFFINFIGYSIMLLGIFLAKPQKMINFKK